ncbi:MAG TPA: choice-of-anchor tandem repeat GloVer-containing protein [Bacteroidia bacterium]|nr:choice-of-anchor tandem repeat GloVer-containing protein [Bacteroidia bacterium]
MMKKLLVVLLFTLGSSLITICKAQYTVLHNFNDTAGIDPIGSLIISGNKLYGMTPNGGPTNNGCVFCIDTNGNTFTDIFNFNWSNGSAPANSLTLIGSKLYGTTRDGGSYGFGCIFSLDDNGGGYSDMSDFNVSKGSEPYSNLTSLGGKFYGMTRYGGYNGDGCIFSIDTNGGGDRDLFDFSPITGQNPISGSLIFYNGSLFGMTTFGGTNGKGCVFSIDTSGSKFTDLFDFDGSNGKYPVSTLVLFRGSLYGMTSIGGLYGDGVIFKLHTNSVEGINELTLNKGGNVKVFPNPSNGLFQLQANSKQLMTNSSIEVYNMLGEKIYSKQFFPQGSIRTTLNSQLSIDISNNANGIYLYRVTSNSGELMGEGKLIIQR